MSQTFFKSIFTIYKNGHLRYLQYNRAIYIAYATVTIQYNHYTKQLLVTLRTILYNTTQYSNLHYDYLLPRARGEGVLPYMGNIGMCGLKGYGFSAVLVINWVSSHFAAILVINRISIFAL